MSASPPAATPPGQRPARNLVTRADGRMVNVARKTGQLFFCATGCCCGHPDKGVPPVPADLYHSEWERRRLRNKVHLTSVGCLGPCPLANVVMLLFDGHPLWFHSMNSTTQVLALYDYIDQMLAAQRYLPPPAALSDHSFSGFNWERPGEGHTVARPAAVERSGFLFLTQSDSDILALSRALERLPDDFPRVEAHNLSNLHSDADVEALLAAVLPEAEVVVLRLLGGRASFARGLDLLAAHAAANDQWLVCLPGTDTLDPELTAASNVGVPVTHEVLAYLQHGGVKNLEHALRFLSDHLLMTGHGFDLPEPQPRHGVYHPDVPEGTPAAWRQRRRSLGWDHRPTLGVLFYRSHLLAGNTAFIDAVVRQGEARGLNVLPVYAYSLKEADIAGGPVPPALQYFFAGADPAIDVLLCTTSFALGGTGAGDEPWTVAPLDALGVPVLQGITASISHDQWAGSQRGLNPIDTGINVAIPEFDGRIISVPISFKGAPEHRGGCAAGGPGVAAAACTCTGRRDGPAAVAYHPAPDRIDRVLGLAERLITLRRKPNTQKRIAFLLTNYASKAARIANAVGLDSPASLLRLLGALQQAGYAIDGLPNSGDALMAQLIDRGNYDLEVLTQHQLDGAGGHVSGSRYRTWFGKLPEKQRREVAERWGAPPGVHYVDSQGRLALAGVAYGNALVAIQPPRGYGLDPAAIYHMPDLPPPHPYHALYRWLATPVDDGGWGADAIVHLGKHGTLEWLPGKGIGLSADCYPDSFLGDLPLVYPFIINNPGEGAQAKRRTHAVIVDHLTPPMTTAEGYGELEQLARIVDEYYQMEKLDPSKLPLLQQQIWELIRRAQLDTDLGRLLNWGSEDHTHEWDPEFHEDGVPYTISDLTGRDFAHLVDNINGYLCELTSAQIRDGLHILGQPPQGDHLIDTMQALVRLPNLDVPSLRAGVAATFGVDLNALLERLEARLDVPNPGLEAVVGSSLTTHADVLDAIDRCGRALIAGLSAADFVLEAVPGVCAAVLGSHPAPPALLRTLGFLCTDLAPKLARTTEEIDMVVAALAGRHIPPGPSGAPTRGMAHILPTGRNFFTVDPRGIPSEAAWQVGQQLAAALLERHRAEAGALPESVGISIWGTSAMRTHGDDVAQVLALLGMRPRWQPESRRLVGVDPVPLAELGRPRIDVVCRISGFFRDAFPHLIALLDEAFRTAGALDEPPEQNFLRKHLLAERARLAAARVAGPEAARRAGYRIFGSQPGSYGAGILPLIDAGNWQDSADFAETYVNWGGYAYTAEEYGVDARPAFRQALATVEVAVKNQDNREHDIFDSDDYLQYHGGMIATIRALTGRNPRAYFGDNADPQRARVRDLKDEALRVFRSRVINPKWIASVQRHGYKGALELAATVDYLFGYDATAGLVEGWMYQRLAEAYVLDPEMQAFLQRSNPWAMKDMAARLLEAAGRGLWPDPGETLAALQTAYLAADGHLEGRTEPAAAERTP